MDIVTADVHFFKTEGNEMSVSCCAHKKVKHTVEVIGDTLVVKVAE